ncbi:MAG: hypothetical protein GTN69_03415 [Armatimonadetes bacterium]|nr:hypothetical protein [Armatimonadota bacterium]
MTDRNRTADPWRVLDAVRRWIAAHQLEPHVKEHAAELLEDMRRAGLAELIATGDPDDLDSMMRGDYTLERTSYVLRHCENCCGDMADPTPLELRCPNCGTVHETGQP